jgi:hypothetical protein
MIGRRRMLGAGMIAGMVGSVGGRDAEAAPLEQRPSRDDDQEMGLVRRAVEEVRDAILRERQFVELTAVRNAQQMFLRTNGKLPDMIEVGMDVWFGVHDWHVRWQQPLVAGRDAGGRYIIKLMDTTVVLRPETPATFVGIPFDNR